MTHEFHKGQEVTVAAEKLADWLKRTGGQPPGIFTVDEVIPRETYLERLCDCIMGGTEWGHTSECGSTDGSFNGHPQVLHFAKFTGYYSGALFAPKT